MPPPGIADLTESMEKPSSRSKPTRKDTIMTLVELLLKEDTSRGACTAPSSLGSCSNLFNSDQDPSRQEDEKDDCKRDYKCIGLQADNQPAAYLDEQEMSGAEAFKKFQK